MGGVGMGHVDLGQKGSEGPVFPGPSPGLLAWAGTRCSRKLRCHSEGHACLKGQWPSQLLWLVKALSPSQGGVAARCCHLGPVLKPVSSAVRW